MPQNEGEPSFQEILQFDPFSTSDGGDAPAGGDNGSADGGAPPPPAQSGEENAGGQQQQEGQAPPPEPAAAAPPAEPPRQTSQADIEAAIRQIPAAIRAGLERQQPPQPQPAAQKFNLAVPEALVTALRSEDPKEFSTGVGAMINGVANHVWNTVMDHLEKTVGPSIPQAVERYVQTVRSQEAVANDFYGQYPQLNIPELMPMVQAVGATIAQEHAARGLALNWSPQLRDAIAERIFARLPMLRGTAPAPAAPPQRRQFSTGNGARPPASPDTPEKDMMAVLFGGPGVG